MLVNKSSKKLHEDIKIYSNNSTIKGENFMIIGYGMTSSECYENKWFYMKYPIGKYLSGEILLTREYIFLLFSYVNNITYYAIYGKYNQV